MSRRKTIPRRCATLVAGWSLRHPEGRNKVEEPALRRLVSKATPATQSRINRRDVVLAGGRTGAVAAPGRTVAGNGGEEIRHGLRATTARRSGRAGQAAGCPTLTSIGDDTSGPFARGGASNRAHPTTTRDVQQTTAASERIWIACRLSERNGGDRRKFGRRGARHAQRL